MFFTETGTRNVYDKNLLLLIVRRAMILAKLSYKKRLRNVPQPFLKNLKSYTQ